MQEKMVVVDLHSGSHPIHYERFNFDKNSFDGFYYGYAPPYDEFGDSGIKRLGKNANGCVDGVLVVYVQKIGDTNKNREIVAYCENATVFKKPQNNAKLKRDFIDEKGTGHKAISYSIKSDNLTDLQNCPEKFVIEIAKYNSYIFRRQRSYLEKYPELKKEILEYINAQKDEQAAIQNSKPASTEDSLKYSELPDETIEISSRVQVKKNPAIAKKVLQDSNYACSFEKEHITFTTSNNVPYMEGHHLIPCTVENSEKFKKFSKLDREENIVCVCPTCHRAIHYGDAETKRRIIEKLFCKKADKLNAANLKVSLEDLYELYRVKV